MVAHHLIIESSAVESNRVDCSRVESNAIDSSHSACLLKTAVFQGLAVQANSKQIIVQKSAAHSPRSQIQSIYYPQIINRFSNANIIDGSAYFTIHQHILQRQHHQIINIFSPKTINIFSTKTNPTYFCWLLSLTALPYTCSATSLGQLQQSSGPPSSWQPLP